VSAGPLPDDVDQLVFPAIQTYDDGETVRWIEETPEGGAEPEHPAPVLTLTAAEEDDHGGGDTSDTTAADGHEVGGTAAAAGTGNDDDDGDDSNGLAIAALVVGVLALIVGGAALARGRSAASP
jgi:uncharacterized protein YcnI